MLDALIALTLTAASQPKVAYKPDPKSTADVGVVTLESPRRHPCFGVVRGAVLLSSRKTDRNQAWAVTVTVADSNAPERILSAALGGTELRLVNVKNGDVACTDYQCPQGSAAVFELPDPALAAVGHGGAAALEVKTSAGENCDVSLPVEDVTLQALRDWAAALPRS
jgi:hypothetical protein